MMNNTVKFDMKKEKIAILLCTYNGKKYIEEQIKSYFTQSEKNWWLYVSDDGSNDETLNIIQKIFDANNCKRLTIIQGPRKGATANFLSLLCSSKIDGHDYYSFSDQDDIWLHGKLEAAINALEAKNEIKPLLFCSTTTLINEAGKIIYGNPKIINDACLPNALGHIIATGNTMVFNKHAREILLKAGPDINPAGHDWWTYIAVTATNGEVIFDKNPGLLYRMHSNNVAGISIGIRQRVKKFYSLLKDNEIKKNHEKNTAALKKIENELSPSAKRTIEILEKARNSIFPKNVYYLFKSRIKRRTPISQIALFIAALRNNL